MRVFWSAVVIFVLDQVTKVWIVFGLGLIDRGVIEVAPPYLRLTMAWNRGVNFGLLAHDSDVVRWALVAVSLAISAWVWVWIRKPGQAPLAQLSGGILIGGALGNVVDRVLYGAVADFLNMSCCGIQNPYAFNVADIAIFAGAFGLVLFAADGKTPADKGPKTP